MPSQLRSPEDVRKRLSVSWERNRADWLSGAGQWPLSVVLGKPTQADARPQFDAIGKWVREWQSYDGPGRIEWEERNWSALGRQSIPARLLLDCPEDVARCTGQDVRWKQAHSRYLEITNRWSALSAVLPKYFDLLADYSDADLHRLVVVLSWLLEHPHSNLYPRQLPLEGIDTKWLEARGGTVTELLGALRGDGSSALAFHECCGLRPLPKLLRLNVLDAGLRAQIGGIRDVMLPPGELARLPIVPKCIFIIENLQTALAFEDLESTIVVTGFGYGLDTLNCLPNISHATVFYWGDIDTHGFAMLSIARGLAPQISSLLMDQSTLHLHRDLWGNEPTQHASDVLPNLTVEEQKVFQGLKQHTWATSLRLEQERISWLRAEERIQEAHRLAVVSDPR